MVNILGLAMAKLIRTPMTSVRASLQTFAAALQADSNISDVLLAGSCALGGDDEVSDIDLWVVSEDWTPDRLGGLLVAGRLMAIAGIPFYHGVDRNGTIVDLMIGPNPWSHYAPILASDASFDLSGSQIPADLFTDFWINSYKHRKPLFRGLDPMVCFGLHHDRMFLVRAWVLADTGADPGDSAFTIHGLTPLIQNHVVGRPERQELLGLPARNRREMVEAIDAYRGEMLSLMPAANALTELVMGDPVYRGLYSCHFR